VWPRTLEGRNVSDGERESSLIPRVGEDRGSAFARRGKAETKWYLKSPAGAPSSRSREKILVQEGKAYIKDDSELGWKVSAHGKQSVQGELLNEIKGE